jgi:hypothetical protein
MSRTSLRRPTAVGAGLVLATLLTWWLGTGHPFSGTSVRLASALAMAVAMAKVHYVAMDFMELRTAALPLRVAFFSWLWGLSFALGAIYLT